MQLSDLEKIRYEKILAMRQAGREPYPTRSEVTCTITEAIHKFEAVENGPDVKVTRATVAGRLRAIRLMGKLAFAHIEDGTGRIQLFMRVNELGEEAMEQLKNEFDLGDFIQAKG